MKIRSFAAALALAAAPGLLAAQQTQSAQAHGRHGGWQQGQRGEHRGGIQALIARRDQLHLTGDQVSRLQAIQQRLESQNRPLQDRMRALFQQSGLPDFRARRAERGAQGQQGQRAERPQLTEQQRQALRRVRGQAKPIREQMRRNHQAALREVQAVLTAAQKQQVQQWHGQHQERRGERRHGGRHGEGRQGQQGARGSQG